MFFGGVVKYYISLLVVLFSFNCFAVDDVDKKILTLLKSDEGRLKVTSPRGVMRGVLLARIQNLSIVAVKKDLLLGVHESDVKVTSAWMEKNEQLNIFLAFDAKHFGLIFLEDKNEKLGKESLGDIKSKIKVQKYFANQAEGLKLTQLETSEDQKLIILGRVRLGMFVGDSNGGGKKGKDRYKIFKNLPFGSLVARSNQNHWSAVSNSGINDKVAFLSIPKNTKDISLILNDVKVTDNNGLFYIVSFK